MTEADICKRQKLIMFASVCDIISLLPTGAPLLSQIDFCSDQLFSLLWSFYRHIIFSLSRVHFCFWSPKHSHYIVIKYPGGMYFSELCGIDEDKVLSENIYYRVGDTDWDNHN